MEELPEHSEASAGLLLEWMKNRMIQDGETVLQNLFQTGGSRKRLPNRYQLP